MKALTRKGQSAAVLRIAPIAADLRFGPVGVKGRACSIAERLALDACRAGPQFSMIAGGAIRERTVRRQCASTVAAG